MDVYEKLLPYFVHLAKAFSWPDTNILTKHRPSVDHEIHLQEGAKLLFKKGYNMNYN